MTHPVLGRTRPLELLGSFRYDLRGWDSRHESTVGNVETHARVKLRKKMLQYRVFHSYTWFVSFDMHQYVRTQRILQIWWNLADPKIQNVDPRISCTSCPLAKKNPVAGWIIAKNGGFWLGNMGKSPWSHHQWRFGSLETSAVVNGGLVRWENHWFSIAGGLFSHLPEGLANSWQPKSPQWWIPISHVSWGFA